MREDPTTTRGTATQLAASLPDSDSELDTGDHTGMGPDRESPPATPRWVKAFGIIAIVLVLLFVGLHVSGNAPMHTMSFSGTEHGMQAP
jgi:hypothetical protein